MSLERPCDLECFEWVQPLEESSEKAKKEQGVVVRGKRLFLWIYSQHMRMVTPESCNRVISRFPMPNFIEIVIAGLGW